VMVFESVYGWQDSPNDGFLIPEYSIQNISGQDIENLYAAQYLDWDIAEAVSNKAGFLPEAQLGYMYADSSNYYGLCAVMPAAAAHYSAVYNPDYVWPPADFTDDIKFQFISGQIEIHQSDKKGDWSHIMSYGPFSLSAGESMRIAFAILGGSTLEELAKNARTARQLYTTVSATSTDRRQIIRSYKLYPPAPNPIRSEELSGFSIAFDLPRASKVSIKIYNILGQEIFNIPQKFYPAGHHQLRQIGSELAARLFPPGVYFISFRAANFRQTQKVLFLH